MAKVSPAMDGQKQEDVDLPKKSQLKKRIFPKSTLEGHQDWVRSVCVTADGEKIISGSDDKTVKVWSMSSGECLSTLEGHRADVRSVCV
jgi:WD40 repeat protein